MVSAGAEPDPTPLMLSLDLVSKAVVLPAAVAAFVKAVLVLLPMMLMFDPTSMRIELPPSSKNVRRGCLRWTEAALMPGVSPRVLMASM